MDETVGDSIIGGAGTLAAAALETGGYYMQSKFLDTLLDGPIYTFGAFFFLMSLLAGLIMSSLGGEYKHWLWFLVSPGLLMFVLGYRVPADSADWRFGYRDHNDEWVTAAVEDLNPGTVQVSWLFARWNALTSSVVNNFVLGFDLFDAQSDINVLKKAQKYHSVFNMELSDGLMNEMVHLLLLNHCQRYLAVQLTKYQEPRAYSDAEYNAIVDAMNDEIVISSLDENSYAILNKLQSAGYLESGWQIDVPIIGPIGVGEDQLADSYTCPDLWKLSVNTLENFAREQVHLLVLESMQEQEDEQIVYNQLTKKFGDRCDGGDTACYATAADSMYRFIALRMISRTLSGQNPHLAQMATMDHSLPRSDRNLFNVSQNMGYEATKDEYEGKGEFLSLVLGLPYLQGVILFFLGLSFPAVAFTLLVPGRQWALGTWMSLWFWAKSWDIGFAAVMIVDKVLYYLLPRGPVVDNSVFYDPAEAFLMAFSEDPTPSINAYYKILALLFAAVPLMTGVFVKRGGSFVVELAYRGTSNITARIGGTMTEYLRSQNSSGASPVVGQVSTPEGYTALGSSQQRSYQNTVAGKALTMARRQKNPDVEATQVKAKPFEAKAKSSSKTVTNQGKVYQETRYDQATGQAIVEDTAGFLKRLGKMADITMPGEDIRNIDINSILSDALPATGSLNKPGSQGYMDKAEENMLTRYLKEDTELSSPEDKILAMLSGGDYTGELDRRSTPY